jgi:RNA polymerase sigma-70 factor (ECF subfamily)
MLMEREIHRRLEAQQYRQAFEVLLEQFQGRVFRLAWSMLRNQALAEETAQEIFIRVWKALPGYRARSSLSTWIYAIARNACLTALEARERERALDLRELMPADRFEHHEPADRQRDLERLLVGLPENYRQVLTLFYLEERSYEEVARMLGLPMGTVKTWLHRAKKQLAAAMRPEKSEQRSHEKPDAVLVL